MFSNLSSKLNSAAGGGRESEKNEDGLDKGIFPFSTPPPLKSHSTISSKPTSLF